MSQSSAALATTMVQMVEAAQLKTTVKTTEAQVARLKAEADIMNHTFAENLDYLKETHQHLPKYQGVVAQLTATAQVATATLAGVVVHDRDQELGPLTLDIAAWKQMAAVLEGKISTVLAKARKAKSDFDQCTYTY